MTNTLFLCGDVMTGRGVDQILPHPSRPRIYEPVVKSALDYVALAERAHGAIPRRVDYFHVWGDSLAELARRRPAARIVNLETSVTTSDDAVAKGINYRMHPDNVPVLTAADIDCAVLANNHVLDWGQRGLRETLDSLARANIRTAGAGRTLAEAETPAVIPAGNGRILVFALGGPDSGIPPGWSVERLRPGVFRLNDYSRNTVERVAQLVESTKRSADVAVASVHWGDNWGYDILASHRRFAHDLIDYASIDVVHGHSSHHPKAIEVHLGRPILFGCGDFLNDYEGIAGEERYRGDLVVMYFVTLDAGSRGLTRLEMVPMQIRKFRLGRPARADAQWLRHALDRECSRFGHRVVSKDDHFLLEWT